MKTIGLIGGMSWESSREYYRIINEHVRDQLRGLHSAKIVIVSFDFAEIAVLQDEGKWDDAAQLLIIAAQRLEQAGADVLVICSNTMHKVVDQAQKNVTIPFLHIADVTGEEIKSRVFQRVGLLGTKLVMEDNFYKERLTDKYGLEVIVPEVNERNVVDHIIYNELCRGQMKKTSKERLCEIMQNLAANGAEGIILGCTELGLLIDPQDVQIPLFDTATIHAKAAARFALT
ncbi:MAG: aspartate racemase [Planctomycetes bacterium RBG_16_55_9]|nr:MAG: aspartate racemase [Planctomycetes bacterium RBG_16_55_9]